MLEETTEPFFFPGNEIGCLLIHRFAGAPTELQQIALEISSHVVTRDMDKDLVFQATLQFLQDFLESSP